MPKIVVGYIPTPEGEAALERAIEEARLRDAELVIVNSDKGGPHEKAEKVIETRDAMEAVSERLTAEGVRHSSHEYVRGQTVAEDLVQAARDEGAELIIIGLRRRTATGKYLLGSNAQDILLEADCPVIAVKAED